MERGKDIKMASNGGCKVKGMSTKPYVNLPSTAVFIKVTHFHIKILKNEL